MAKMHSRARGNAHSHKPLKPAKPTWIRHQSKEVEMLVAKLSKEGKSASEVGLILRDSYGVPSVKLLTGKRIQEILAEKKLLPELPEDMLALMRQSVLLKKHLETNKHDMTALRGLQFAESKIKRLVKYYKRAQKLPVDWKFDANKVKMYTQ